ncbi:hypothetical protein [Microbulbifer sp. SAOS-129_SWC]|uniref:hypothetical protein n=1 Tax=Microbulbifer sp. SAOS-129_SWC TaxID=3145235 RepID=UPI0032165806
MRILIVLLLIFLPNSGWCNDEQDLDNLAKPIISALERGEIHNLMSLVFPKDSPLRKYISESDLESTNSQFSAKLSQFGKLRGISLYYESKVEGVISIRYYLLQYERQPVLLKIESYNPKDAWRIQDITVDGDLDDYLEEAAKVKLGTLGLKSDSN